MLFLSAQALDATAGGVAQVALPWLVLDATGSKATAGLVFAIELLPYVVFGLPAGLAGDRLDRRKLIWISHAVEAVFALLIPLWIVSSGTPPLWVIAISAFGIGTARAFGDAGAFGAVASIVGPEHFTGGQAILSSAWAVGLFAGPALGGALIAVVGPGKTLVVQGAAFAAAALCVIAVRSSFGERARSEQGLLDGLVEGVRFLVTDPLLRWITLLGAFGNIVAAGVPALIVPLLRTEIGLTSNEAGGVLAGGAALGIVSAPIVHRLERRLPGPRLYVLSLFLLVPPPVALGVAVGVGGAAIAYGAEALFTWIEMAVFIGERQRRAPDDLQARVGISGRMLMTLSLAVGASTASALTTVFTLRELYVGMGLATLVTACLAAVVIPRATRALAAAM